MEIFEILKDSVKYPFADIKMLLIIGVILLAGSILESIGAYIDNGIVVILGMIASLVLSILVMGYSLDIFKFAIGQDGAVPELDIEGNLKDGVKLLIVSIIYYIIPGIITLVAAILTSGFAFTRLAGLNNVENATAAEAASQIFTPDFVAAIGVVMVIAIVLYIIFTLLALMGEARLARTGSIDEAISFRQSYTDLKEIGIGKTLALLILLFILVAIVIFIMMLVSFIPIAGIFIATLIGAPFILFMQNRAYGLLYSEIA